MKQGVMKKVFKVIAFIFLGMFLYGVVTFALMIMKYGLHFGYVSNGDIELISGLLVIAVIFGATLSGNSNGKSVVGGYSYEDDDNDIVTDPTYSVLDCNIFHEDNIFDD